MAFQSLISGADCAVASNPLSQVLKLSEGDRSIQQDRLGPSTSRFHQLPARTPSSANEQDVGLARQFFKASSSGHLTAPSFPFHYPPELAHMEEMNGRPGIREAWALDQQLHQQRSFDDYKSAAWAAEFRTGPQTLSSPSLQDAMSKPEFQQRQPFTMYNRSMPLPFQSMNAPLQYGLATNLDYGKGKGKEVDFEAAFAQFSESYSHTESRIEEVHDEKLIEALDKVNLNAEDDSAVEGDFRKVWDQLQQSDLPPPMEDMAKWEAEFSQLMNAQRDELEDYGTSMQNVWEGGIGSYEGGNATEFDVSGIPILGNYEFEKTNKYLDPSSSSRSLLNDAKSLLENNGSLSEAALMLEAAIQRGELGEGGYESWILLGETRNMDEREEAGMRALLNGVRISEEAGTPGPGMLSLAISFTNESYSRGSHSMLLRWFRSSFPEVQVPAETINAMQHHSSWDTHERITKLFLEVARSQHGANNMDPDLQIGLGVLFYTNGEYDRAQDCFAAALNVRPQDYLLWNRLGSSLSNGKKPEEALGAYREALQLRPTYTRAIYNVGVACLNIGADKEAAEHFLSALSLQESTGDTSDQLWFTLRRAFLSMNRSDLAELANTETKSNLDVFRREGFDF